MFVHLRTFFMNYPDRQCMAHPMFCIGYSNTNRARKKTYIPMLNSTNSEYCKTCICVNSALCVLNDLYFFSVMKVVKNIFKKTPPFGRSLCDIVKFVNCFVMCQVYLSGIDVTACYTTGPMHANFYNVFYSKCSSSKLEVSLLSVFVEPIKVRGCLQN